MPNPLYARVAKIAAELLSGGSKGFGQSATITRTPHTLIVATGEVIDGTSVVGKISFVVVPIATAAGSPGWDNGTEDASLTGRQLRCLKIAAYGAPYTPAKDDVVTFDGADWEIQGCTPLNPAGVPIAYICGVARL